MKLNENGYAIRYSRKLACTIWALSNDWESLLIWNSACRNVQQVLADMVISREIHNKKVILYLNKQSIWISYEDISPQSRKWKAAFFGGESGTTPLLKRLSTHSSIDNVDEETESILLHLTNSNLFQPNLLLMITVQVIQKCADPWHILTLEQLKKLQPSQSVGCGFKTLT